VGRANILLRAGIAGGSNGETPWRGAGVKTNAGNVLSQRHFMQATPPPQHVGATVK